MKKLKLDIDALKVDTFDAGDALPRTGTVRGLVAHTQNACPVPLTVVGSDPGATCLLECTGTCGNTYGDCCGASGRFTCDYCYG